MEGGRFRVRLETLPEVASHGAERVDFQVSLNPGFDPAPLARVASGGELSRVMLALKTVLAEVDGVPSLVFDEIDSGVGGRVAHRVAERLAMVARNHQVFAITHLPQIASRASVHLYVEKVQKDGLASARVRTLEGEERVEELARMLGGDPGRETSRKHAAELLSE
jgi:DNA repair protein RecN (Recombination protein N)